MRSLHHIFARRAACAVSFLSLLQLAPALDIQYCSSQNTGVGDPTYWQYQSNGWCHDLCVDKYAFAIIQEFNCWCSDYAPGVTASATSCNAICPGFGSERCGGSGVYGYIALNKEPAGTSAAAASSPAPEQVTVTATGAPITVFSTAASSNPTGQKTTSAVYSHTSTWVPTPITSVETVTGQVRTITITPTTPSTSNMNGAPIEKPPSAGLTTAQAVGLTVGLVAVIAIIATIIFLMVRKRRQARANDQYDEVIRGDSSSGQLPKRTMSETSRYMLGTDGRQVVEGWEPEPEAAGSRRSRLMPVDPRLDPFAPVYQRGDGNRSRESIATLRDDHDYSRRVHQNRPILRATNPDT